MILLEYRAELVYPYTYEVLTQSNTSYVRVTKKQEVLCDIIASQENLSKIIFINCGEILISEI